MATIVRELDVQEITNAVCGLFLDACCNLGEDAVGALSKAHEVETSPYGIEVLRQLLENAELATNTARPYCQDTGMAVVFMDVGQDVHLVGGDVTNAVDEGVRRAYVGGYLRKSVLSALERKNTGDNTPAILHLRLVPGDKVDITVAPKGFGSENMSRLAMLKPSAGIEGVQDFIVETVRIASANPCPPIVLGIGIGGTMEACALLAKRQLLRDVGAPSHEPELAGLESELLARINQLDIGPMGLGGAVTALAVHIAQMPTHLAGLPVAVNVQCHAARHKHVAL